MSWRVDIQNHKDETIEFKEPHHIKGGTYIEGGTTRASINITYNYSRYLREFWDDALWSLHNRAVNSVIPELERAVTALGTDSSDDYWESTAGNAGRALEQLLHLCRLAIHEYPDEHLHLVVC